MYVLGIETSCDETSAAVVKDGKHVLSNVVTSSLKFHRKHGGVIPEIASRLQLETIVNVADDAVKEARISLHDVNLVCVTSSPGLLGSLLVGISFAKSVSLALDIPLLGVDHVHSHMYANFLDKEKIRLPFVGLVVSGGHTSLFYVSDFDKIEILGQTQDDACGEAFDKVAKMLGLGYPGGPIIEKLGRKGNSKKIKFNCSGTKQPFDFSFSGIKTAVLYYVKKHGVSKSRNFPEKSRNGQWITDPGLIPDIAASFQETAIDTLVKKSLLACKFKKVNRLLIGGGVVANSRLREKFYQATKEKNIDCFFPKKELCMDNAAMSAGFGFQLFKKGIRSGLDLSVN